MITNAKFFFAKLHHPNPHSQHKRMWPVHTIPTSSFFGAHGGHFLFEEFPGLGVPSFGSYLAKGPPVSDKGVLSTATVLLHIAWGTKKWMLKKIKTQCI